MAYHPIILQPVRDHNITADSWQNIAGGAVRHERIESVTINMDEFGEAKLCIIIRPVGVYRGRANEIWIPIRDLSKIQAACDTAQQQFADGKVAEITRLHDKVEEMEMERQNAEAERRKDEWEAYVAALSTPPGAP